MTITIDFATAEDLPHLADLLARSAPAFFLDPCLAEGEVFEVFFEFAVAVGDE